jgi:hypothetical protein
MTMTAPVTDSPVSAARYFQNSEALGKVQEICFAAHNGNLVVDIGASGERPDAAIELSANQAAALLERLPRLLDWIATGSPAATWDHRSGFERTERGLIIREPQAVAQG